MTDTLSSNSNFFAWLEVYSKQKVSLPLNHRFIAVFAGLVLEWSNRGQMKQLLNATPEHLADIGINKSELKSAL